MKTKSFTLIELLVVIAIIGLLSSIVLVNISQQGRERARIAKIIQYSASVYHSLGDEIVGYWKFDEGVDDTCGTFDVCDSSGRDNHGTRVNAVWISDSPTGDGYALDFEAESDEVAVVDSASLTFTDAITLEAWIRLDVDSGCNSIIYKYESDWTSYWRGFHFERCTDSVRIRLAKEDESYPPNFLTIATLMVGDWTHVVVTYDKNIGKIKTYINGEFSSEQDKSDIMTPSSATLRIGGWSYNGSLDEVRLYTNALAAHEIQQHYVEGLEKHQLAISP